MATQFKFTAKRGALGLADIVVAAGSAEAQSDTMSLNIDMTDMSKGEALLLIDKIRDKIAATPYPAV